VSVGGNIDNFSGKPGNVGKCNSCWGKCWKL